MPKLIGFTIIVVNFLKKKWFQKNQQIRRIFSQLEDDFGQDIIISDAENSGRKINGVKSGPVAR